MQFGHTLQVLASDIIVQ